MKNLKKGLVAGLLSIVISLGAVMPSFAAVSGVGDPYYTLQFMPDGGVFDPAWYHVHNPDIVKLYSGDDGHDLANDLYNHYKKYGAKEGRAPYAVGTDTTVDFDPSYLVDPAASQFAGYYTPIGDYDHYLYFEVDPTDPKILILTSSSYDFPTLYLVFDHTNPCDPGYKMYSVCTEDGDLCFRIVFSENFCMVIADDFSTRIFRHHR